MEKPAFIEIKKLEDGFAEVTFHKHSKTFEYLSSANGTMKKFVKRYRPTKYRFWDSDGSIRLSKVHK